MQFPQNKMVYLCKDPNRSYEIYSQAMLPYERGVLYYCHHDMFSNISLEIFRTNILGTNSLSANWSAKTIPSLSKQILINYCQLNPVWNWLIFTDSLLFGRYRSAHFASVFLSSLFLIRSDPTSFIQLAIKYSTRLTAHQQPCTLFQHAAPLSSPDLLLRVLPHHLWFLSTAYISSPLFGIQSPKP